MIRFLEHHEPGYANRTIANARAADLTIAFAVDFTTLGERLTHKASYGKYIPIRLMQGDGGWNIMGECNDVHRRIVKENIKHINIAGNGIYTFKDKISQEVLDADILLFMQRILSGCEGIPLRSGNDIIIRSGGQTGVDEAALKAGDKLGLETICLAPKNWLFRDIDGKDHMHDADAFCGRFGEQYINNI